MQGKFANAQEVEREKLEWGSLAWLSNPKITGADRLVVIEVTLDPGGGHNFHKHPQQEEVIYVLDGAIEQWVGEQNQILKRGDSVFIGEDTVHASFNMSDESARLLAILGPCIGDQVYELVEVFDREPWSSLRK